MWFKLQTLVNKTTGVEFQLATMSAMTNSENMSTFRRNKIRWRLLTRWNSVCLLFLCDHSRLIRDVIDVNAAADDASFNWTKFRLIFWFRLVQMTISWFSQVRGRGLETAGVMCAGLPVSPFGCGRGCLPLSHPSCHLHGQMTQIYNRRKKKEKKKGKPRVDPQRCVKASEARLSKFTDLM